MNMYSLLIVLFGLYAAHTAQAETPIQLQCLWSSYRNFKVSADKKNIEFQNNGVMPFVNRNPQPKPVDRTFLTSIDQMFAQPYAYGFKSVSKGKKTYRFPTFADQMVGARYQPLFKALYGHAPEQVERDLVSVQWVDGSWVLFNRRYGAAKALQNVVKKLKTMIAERPELKKYLYNSAGTYNWRNISHQSNLSMHSFGTAIDINLRYSDYWLWDMGPDHKVQYRNRIPVDIAEVFEQNGFIWGGKWYHYDTMHFEYRPELVMARQSCEKGFESYRD